MTINDIKKIINPFFRRVMLMVSKAVVKKTDSSQKAQLSIFEDEVRDDIPIIQQYGFVSRPLDDTDSVVVFISGNRDNGIVISTRDKNYTVSLEKGEVALFDNVGTKIHLKKDKKIEITIDTNTYTITKDTIESASEFTIKAAGTSYSFKSTGLETAADIKGGTIEGTTQVKVGLIGLTTHKHTSASAGSPTSTPIP